MESEFTVVPCQQRDRERLPLLAQPRTLSGGSIKLDVTPLTNAAPHRMQSSDAWDMLVLGVEHGGLNVGSVRSPLPWEGGIKDFQFINSQCACTPDLIGAFGDWVVSASSTLLLFTLSSRVIIYDIVRKKSREIHYGFHVKSTSSVAHTLSPDGKTLVRWMFDEENQDSTLLVIDVRAKDQIAQSRRSYQCQQHDILYARWIDESTIYIPISAEGIIIRWIIRDSAPQDGLENSSVRPGDLTVIQPSESITRHSILKLDVTKDGAWWTASGITLSDPPSGHIQAHHVETEESSFLKGLASCIAVADVHDKERVLLVSAGITPDFQLQFHVEQLDSEDSGHPFMTVDVDVDLIEEKDYPTDIIALHPLPIVAVMTEKSYSYFFELHSGAYLYSQAHKSYRFCPGQSAKRELLLWSHEKSDVQALSINEDDLIRYCRKVLKDDSLAEAIASRTGHRGAKDIILDDM
ncbi:hypothetical protein FRC03_008053 [Tulasnella sp. 419]|nr:hypothetical protein FRC03_008053 [Tulasnella sp. 419]